VSSWQRVVRRWGKLLYDFEGLQAFKTRLRPHGWDRIHLAWPARHALPWTTYDMLTAFAQGSLMRFGLATLQHRPALLAWLLMVPLVPWTVLLALPASAPHFPSPLVHGGWVLFDVTLVGTLLSLARRWRAGLAKWLVPLVAGNAGLTLLQALVYNLPRAHGFADWLVMALAVLAPSLATLLLSHTPLPPGLEPG
jgi:hypothetical protein